MQIFKESPFFHAKQITKTNGNERNEGTSLFDQESSQENLLKKHKKE